MVRATGQGHRLVRQRVGLLQPPGRPHGPRRRAALRPLDVARDSTTCEVGGQARAASAPTSTCRSDLGGRRNHRRRPDPRRRADHRHAGRPRRPGDRRPHLGRPKGARRAPAGGPRSRRSPPGSLSCSAGRSRSPPTWSARLRPRPPSPGWPTARSRCWRTSASTPARPARTTRSAARSPTGSPRWPTLYVGDGFGAVHRKHACVYDLPAAAAARRRRPDRRRGRGAAQAHRGPGTALRGGARRRPRSPTSSASSTTCWTRPTAS